MPVAVDEEFQAKAGQYRPELLVHCYRLLGSVHEAEDLVQETMVRAWRAWPTYDERRAAVRTWLYAIATNACLSALKGRTRRPLPSGLGAPSEDTNAVLSPSHDIPWLEPFPHPDPLAHVLKQGSLRLALIAALQVLPPKQRAVLILREVLEFTAAETAELLGTSPQAVNSALQRARTTLTGVTETAITEPEDDAARETIERYITAFEQADVDTLVSLLTDDAIMEMPPVPLWYRGRDDYGRFMERVYAIRGTDWRVHRITANGQPTLATYCRTDGVHRAHSLQVFTVTPAGIAHNVVFAQTSVFTTFNLPTTVD